MIRQQRVYSRRLLVLALLVLVLLVVYPQPATKEKTAALPNVVTYPYQVITSYPHDPVAFTQGLAIDNGLLYEGTGRYGLSSVRVVDLHTGKVIRMHRLSKEYYGEGITVFGDRVIQLTWKSKLGFVYDKDGLEFLRTFTYPFEGWGITHDGSRLITSDGTATIRFLDPESFAVNRRIEVTDENGPVTRLNELEYVNGLIYANIWHSDRIAMIDPKTGSVTGWLNLSGILPQKSQSNKNIDVLNGIAYDASKKALYVTGKKWPKLFQIEPVSLKEQ